MEFMICLGSEAYIGLAQGALFQMQASTSRIRKCYTRTAGKHWRESLWIGEIVFEHVQKYTASDTIMS